MKLIHSKSGFFIGFIVLLVSSVNFVAHAEKKDLAVAPEIRAVWMDLNFNDDPEKGRKEVREFVDRLAGANFNVILPLVKSSYVAALTDGKYQKDIPIARWDALGELIKVSRDRGIQVHIWYSFTAYRSPQSPEFNPALGGNPAWASVTINELKADREAGKKLPKRMENICPLHPDGREWELKLLERVLERYPLLAGIHIEEPGYDGDGVCVCDLCLELYQQIYGYKGIPDVYGPQSADLKCTGTTEFMRKLQKQLKTKKRRLVLSTNGGYAWQSDRSSGRDWKRWAEFRWLDFYMPQVYTSDLNKFREYTQTTVSTLGNNCFVAAGIGAKWGRGQNSVDTIVKEIEIARQVGAKGIVIFRGKDLTADYLAALRLGPFKEPAPLPKFDE